MTRLMADQPFWCMPIGFSHAWISKSGDSACGARIFHAVITNPPLPTVIHGLLDRIVATLPTSCEKVSASDGNLAYQFL